MQRFSLALACLVTLAALPVSAQLTPDRTYYGVDRPMPMNVQLPEGAADSEIRLLRRDGELVDSVKVAAGEIDLAETFASLWGDDSPTVLYAQLFAGDEGVGSPVVLQPMVSVDYALGQVSGQRSIRWRRAEGAGFTYSGMRAYQDKHVVMETTEGDIEYALRPDHAPNTAWNFRHLVEGGFYTDIIFHRIIGRGEGFVIQVGDPTGTGSGGPGYMFDLEDSALPHTFGVLSTARSGDPNSNGSQVFVCLSRAGTAALDGLYTAFGEAVSGADVIAKIGATETGPGDRPLDPPSIKRAYLVDAPPMGEGRDPVTKPSDDR